jgi:two-component system KDP operon response regulator KdpE
VGDVRAPQRARLHSSLRDGAKARFAGFLGNRMGRRVSALRSRILALTGEVELHRLLRSILEPDGCEVVLGALPGDEEGDGKLVDIVIVDLEGSDLEFASRVRREFPAAEILAIGRDYREADCIAILEMGVDYLPHPFRAQDLRARVRVAEVRRFKGAGRSRFYRRGTFVIDLFDRSVALDGAPIALAPSALGVLIHLASRPGRMATFADILSGLGRPDSARARRALGLSIFRLRRRIERDPKRPDILLTEAGVGYRLSPESRNEPSLGVSLPGEVRSDGAHVPRARRTQPAARLTARASRRRRASPPSGIS